MVPRGDGAPGVVQHLLTILVTHIHTHTAGKFVWESAFYTTHTVPRLEWSGQRK